MKEYRLNLSIYSENLEMNKHMFILRARYKKLKSGFLEMLNTIGLILMTMVRSTDMPLVQDFPSYIMVE